MLYANIGHYENNILYETGPIKRIFCQDCGY